MNKRKILTLASAAPCIWRSQSKSSGVRLEVVTMIFLQ